MERLGVYEGHVRLNYIRENEPLEISLEQGRFGYMESLNDKPSNPHTELPKQAFDDSCGLFARARTDRIYSLEFRA